jgi:hypothetical protein
MMMRVKDCDIGPGTIVRFDDYKNLGCKWLLISLIGRRSQHFDEWNVMRLSDMARMERSVYHNDEVIV